MLARTQSPARVSFPGLIPGLIPGLLAGLLIGGGCEVTTEPSAGQPGPAPIEAPETPAPSPPRSGQGAERDEPDSQTSPSVPTERFAPDRAAVLVGRVVAVHDEGTGPCGVMHSVGAIEVEVLEVGEPPPHLGLYVSCPSDRRPRLEVGQTYRMELHRRRRPWQPLPAKRLPAALPVRYLESASELPGR